MNLQINENCRNEKTTSAERCSFISGLSPESSLINIGNWQVFWLADLMNAFPQIEQWRGFHQCESIK
jgi:hypothetical protein